MTEEAALEIVAMIDRHWNMYLLAEGSITAKLWLDFLRQQDDVVMTMKAVARLAEQQSARPTVADLRQMIRQVEGDVRATTPALPEPEYEREMPGWVKGWAVARAKGDWRTWPEQKEGYDRMQREHPHDRTYVWPDQDEMPGPERQAYERMGARMTVEQITAMLVATR